MFEKHSTLCWKFHFLGSGQQRNSHAPSSQKFCFYTSFSTKFNQYQPTSFNKTMDIDLAICVHYVFGAGKQNW